MREIVGWIVGNTQSGPHSFRKKKPHGWNYSDGLVTQSYHEAEVARLRADLEGYMMGAAAEAREVDARGEEIKRLRAEVEALRSVANAARQVAAWFSSGNNVPVSGVHQMTVSSSSIMADVHVLNEALATMGASA